MINDDPTPTSVVGLLTSNSAGMAIMQSFQKKFKVPFCKKKKNSFVEEVLLQR